MRRFFNKLAAGVMVATMAFTALAPVTTMAAGNDHTHSFTTATTTPSTSDKDSDTIPIKETLAKVGTKYTIGGNQYTVIKAGEEVRFSKANAKKKSVTIPFSKANAKKKSITIPAIIKADGISYKVTEVGANAFKNNKKFIFRKWVLCKGNPSQLINLLSQ